MIPRSSMNVAKCQECEVSPSYHHRVVSVGSHVSDDRGDRCQCGVVGGVSRAGEHIGANDSVDGVAGGDAVRHLQREWWLHKKMSSRRVKDYQW
jgi:hypothetical protein